MQKNLSLATLGELDNGSVGLIIDAALREAVADLDDRGSDRKPRKATIEITMQEMDNGLTEIHVEAFARVPRRRSASTVSRVGRDQSRQAQLQFQSGAPDNPDQRTIDEIQDKESR